MVRSTDRLRTTSGQGGGPLVHASASGKPGNTTPPPPNPAPGIGTVLALTTNINPSNVGQTVTVRGTLKDVSANPLSGYSVDLDYSYDNAVWSREAQIGTFGATNTNGSFSGTMAFNGTENHNHFIRANFLAAGNYLSSLSPVVTQSVVLTAPPGLRNPLFWPFKAFSIWNLPLGTNASSAFVWAGIRTANSMAFFNDSDVIIMSNLFAGVLTDVYTNFDDWGSGNRCTAQGSILFTAPIPTNFVVPGNHQGGPDGDTPNSCSAILGADGQTVYDTQPFARCSVGSTPTSHYDYAHTNLYGTGHAGSHGGSALSALGGTIRIGELVPGGTIRHAMKLNISETNFYSGFSGFRWPATKSDNGGAGYGGSIPECRMGSLLALKPSFHVSALESGPGKIIGQAMKDYGAYIVDSAGWSVYGIPTEHSPSGSVQSEFQSAWGFSLNATPNANGWARDMTSIMTNLWVVDNLTEAHYNTVATSAGTLGIGGGAPRQTWAPALA